MSGMEQVGSTVTLRSTTDETSLAALDALANELLAAISGAPAPAAQETAAAQTKWVCSVCGYVYEGETLPEGYTCPLCGVGADKFVREE